MFRQTGGVTDTRTQSIDTDDKAVLRALDDLDLPALTAAVRPLSAAQIVGILERLDRKQRAVLYRVLPKGQALEVFENLDPSLQGDLVGGLQDDAVATLDAPPAPQAPEQVPNNVIDLNARRRPA